MKWWVGVNTKISTLLYTHINPIRQIPGIAKIKLFIFLVLLQNPAICVHIFVDIWSSDDVMDGVLEEELEVKLLVPE